MSAPTAAQEEHKAGVQLCIWKRPFIVTEKNTAREDPAKQNWKTGISCVNVCEEEQMKLVPEDAELWKLEGLNICLDL